MNFSDLIKFANQASAFELYRLGAAIERILDDPKRLHDVIEIGGTWVQQEAQ